MDMQLTPQQLQTNLEVLYNQDMNDYGAGFSDALAHIGGMVNGIYSPEVVSETQSEMQNNPDSGYSQSYVEGYIANWNRLTLLTNAALVKADGYGADSDEYLP